MLASHTVSSCPRTHQCAMVAATCTLPGCQMMHLLERYPTVHVDHLPFFADVEAQMLPVSYFLWSQQAEKRSDKLRCQAPGPYSCEKCY